MIDYEFLHICQKDLMDVQQMQNHEPAYTNKSLHAKIEHLYMTLKSRIPLNNQSICRKIIFNSNGQVIFQNYHFVWSYWISFTFFGIV